MTNSRMPGRTIIHLIIWGGLVFLFVLLVIVPKYYKLKSLDTEILKLKIDIEEQNALSPVYFDLKRRIAQYVLPANLPVPKAGGLSREDTNRISSIFSKITKTSNLKLENIRSDVGKDVKAGFILVNVTIRGEFSDLRNFFIRLGEEPFNKFVEDIQIQSIPGFKEVKLKIWITQA